MYLIKIINNYKNILLLSYCSYYVTIKIFSYKTIKVVYYNYVLTINFTQQSNFFKQIKMQEHLGHLQLNIMITQYSSRLQKKIIQDYKNVLF